MFKQAEHPPYLQGIYYLLFVLLGFRLMRTLLAPWLGADLAFAFRSDNFFSFSGGQIRRGLIGEVLLSMQKLGLPSVLMYSLLLLLLFSFIYLWVFPRLLRPFRPLEIILILVSGFFLMPSVDRELLMILPALYFFLRRKQDWGFYGLIALSAFIHELSLLLYFPFIWSLFKELLQTKKWKQLVPLLVIAISYASVILIKGSMSLDPELNYWPQFGISGLEDRFLYTFAGKGIVATLKLHASVFLGDPQAWMALPGMISYFVILLLLLRRFGASPKVISYYLAINLLLFVLTIDYGRYYYFLFLFYLLLTQSGMLVSAGKALQSFRFLMPAFVGKILNFPFSHRAFSIALLIFALAPFGYWIGDTLAQPVLWQELAQLVDFKLPKYAGE